MATIRAWLNDANFDWGYKEAKIIYHPIKPEDGYTLSPGWEQASSREEIDASHSILDKEFDDGFGGPNCPRFIAYDELFIYFPAMYDGSTWLEKVSIDPSHYLEEGIETPYPGGN